MTQVEVELLAAWCMAHWFCAFLIAIVFVLSISAVVRCLFKALGGGYLPRKHCYTCECEQAIHDHDNEE